MTASTLVTRLQCGYESPLAAGATVWPSTDGRQTGRTFSMAVDRIRVSLFINSTRSRVFQRHRVLKFQSVAAANLLSPLRNLTRAAIHLEPSFIIHYLVFFIAQSTERFSCILQLCRWKPERARPAWIVLSSINVLLTIAVSYLLLTAIELAKPYGSRVVIRRSSTQMSQVYILKWCRLSVSRLICMNQQTMKYR